MRNLPVIDYAEAKKIIDLFVEKAAQMKKPSWLPSPIRMGS